MRRGQRAAAPRRLWLRGRRGDDTSSFQEHPGTQGHVPVHRLSPLQAGLPPSVVSDVWRSLHHGRSARRVRSASWRLVHPGEDDEGPARR